MTESLTHAGSIAEWQMVPTEITEEMHAAAVRTAARCSGNDDFPPRVYRAMLAAAPTPPAVMPAAPNDAVMDAIQSAENILDRVALSVGTSTTAEKEREWRDAARIAIGGIRWELSRTALSQTMQPQAEPDEDAWTADQLNGIIKAVREQCGPATARKVRDLIERAQIEPAAGEQAGAVAMPALSCKHSNRSDCGLYGMDEAAPVKFQRPSREWYASKIAETLDDDFAIGSVAPQTDAELQALEREHMGDPDKQTGIYSPNYRIGRWLSAALEDPNTCEEMKSDIRDWFAAPGAAIAARERGVADERLQWLHSPASGSVDGWEWGIFKVKWGRREGEHQIRHTFADFSDLDEAMAASGAALASREEAPATPQGEALTVETLAQELRRIGSAGAEVLADSLMPFLSRAALTQPTGQPFQSRVQPWLMACFGEMIAGDREERNHRFIEEALELVQACGCTASEAHQLVDYVFARPVGEKAQEVGGVMVTLAALCLAQDLDMATAGETELARIWTKVEQIRAKQAAKPKYSPLPAAPEPDDTPLETGEGDAR